MVLGEVGYGRGTRTRQQTEQGTAAHGGRFAEVRWVTWRSLKKLTRNPMLLFFSLVMPLIWLGLFSQTFGTVFTKAASNAPGAPQLPYDYVAVMLPGITIMTAIQSAAQSGFGMVADLETGFMDKFFVAPMRRSSVLMGKLLADGIRMAGQSGIVLLIAYLLSLAGAWRIPFATSVPGALLLMGLAAGFGVAFSGLSNTVALRTKNTEATMMVSFTLTFPLLFLSTAMLPKALLPQWVQDFSTVNPVSYIADAARGLILTGYDWDAIGKAIVAIVAVGAVLNGMAVAAFRAQGK
jgi:ABC-2 type transport system permease protein